MTENENINVVEQLKHALEVAQAEIESKTEELKNKETQIKLKDAELVQRENVMKEMETKTHNIEVKLKTAKNFKDGRYEELIKELFEEPKNNLENNIRDESRRSVRITLAVAVVSILISIATSTGLKLTSNVVSEVSNTAEQELSHDRIVDPNSIEGTQNATSYDSPNASTKQNTEIAIENSKDPNPDITYQIKNIYLLAVLKSFGPPSQSTGHCDVQKVTKDTSIYRSKSIQVKQGCRLGPYYFDNGWNIATDSRGSFLWASYRFDININFGNITFSKKSSINFGDRDSKLSGLLAKDYQHNEINYAANTVIEINEHGVLSGIPDTDYIVNNIPVLGGHRINFYANGLLRTATISSRIDSQGWSIPKHSKVTFFESGLVRIFNSPTDIRYESVSIPANSQIYIDTIGKVSRVDEIGEGMILGLDTANISYLKYLTHGKSENLLLILSNDIQFDKTKCKVGYAIHFSKGNPSKCVDPNNAEVQIDL